MKRFAALLVLLVLAGGGQGGAQTPLLDPADASPFDVGGPSGQVLLADVDDDGHLDLLTRHQQGRAIRTHLGDGRAHFETTTTPVALDFAPGDMSMGDVNGDGILDLVVTASDRDVVDVLLGTANAVFRHPAHPSQSASGSIDTTRGACTSSTSTGTGISTSSPEIDAGSTRFRFCWETGRDDLRGGPVLTVAPTQEGYTLAFGDVDADRDIDAVTAVSSPKAGRLDVHLSNIRGVFRRLRDAVVSVPAPYRIEALADVNSDQRPDLVLSHRGARLSILLNRGAGRFRHATGSPIELGKRPFSVAIVDLNRDAHLDLVSATVDSVTVLLGNGRAFPRARLSSFRAGPGAFNVTVGDVNADERPDVLASSFESNRVTVLLGR